MIVSVRVTDKQQRPMVLRFWTPIHNKIAAPILTQNIEHLTCTVMCVRVCEALALLNAKFEKWWFFISFAFVWRPSNNECSKWKNETTKVDSVNEICKWIARTTDVRPAYHIVFYWVHVIANASFVRHTQHSCQCFEANGKIGRNHLDLLEIVGHSALHFSMIFRTFGETHIQHTHILTHTHAERTR